MKKSKALRILKIVVNKRSYSCTIENFDKWGLRPMYSPFGRVCISWINSTTTIHIAERSHKDFYTISTPKLTKNREYMCTILSALINARHSSLRKGFPRMLQVISINDTMTGITLANRTDYANDVFVSTVTDRVWVFWRVNGFWKYCEKNFNLLPCNWILPKKMLNTSLPTITGPVLGCRGP
jgi:hypothetical protein